MIHIHFGIVNEEKRVTFSRAPVHRTECDFFGVIENIFFGLNVIESGNGLTWATMFISINKRDREINTYYVINLSKYPGNFERPYILIAGTD